MQVEDLLGRLELLVGAKKPADLIQSELDYLASLCDGVESLDEVSPELLGQILLAAGFNQPSPGFHEFFRALAGEEFSFDRALAEWRVRCMLKYGNFRYPYRHLSSTTRDELDEAFHGQSRDLGAKSRLGTTRLDPIEARDTPLLGYIAGAAVKELAIRGEAGEPLSEHEQRLLDRYEQAHAAGLRNTYEYCTMPHLDVYVATSMREFEDFFAVHRFAQALFADPALNRVFYFDPTQSSHQDRIVKGIVEGLMLRRAAVTVYLAQEGDTLGKDSELAATLAQGKVVVAYVPEIADVAQLAQEIVDDSLLATESEPSGRSESAAIARLLERAKKVDVDLWLELEAERGPKSSLDLEDIARRVAEKLKVRYERRAQTLHAHPLGLQVNLSTGVTNGILVARSIDECRDLVLGVMEDSLRFKIVARSPSDPSEREDDLDSPTDWDRLLVECKTGSVHRIVIGDALILNSFWNWFPDA